MTVDNSRGGSKGVSDGSGGGGEGSGWWWLWR